MQGERSMVSCHARILIDNIFLITSVRRKPICKGHFVHFNLLEVYYQFHIPLSVKGYLVL